jgi:transcriptional regulator with XRE-family HTH domain
MLAPTILEAYYGIMSESNAPFITLGKHLKYVREQSEETLAEVSGAVEIDEQDLARIEAGQERPSEDILLLLITHFDVQEREAVQLWELAEYDGDVPEQIRSEIEVPGGAKSVVMLLAMDTRTLYSDGIEIASTPAGLTLHFTQAAPKDQPNSVARLGVSLEQAEVILRELQHGLLKAQVKRAPKRLPPPQNN